MDQLADPLLKLIPDHTVSHIGDELLVETAELLLNGEEELQALFLAPLQEYLLD